MTKRMIIMLVAVAVLLGGVFGFIGFRNMMIAKFMSSMGYPPQAVATAVAKVEPWQPTTDSVGSLRAVNGADLASQVAGTVSAVHFDSGAEVKKGALLVELASADDVAKLEAAKASAVLARITYERNQRQLKAQGVSQQQVDADAQALKSAEAQVAQQQAMVDYKAIRAPFDGRLGIRQVDVGQYLSPGTPMVTLQSLDPIFVDFYLPQQALDEIKSGQAITAKVDTYPNRAFEGTVTAINPKVDQATRNVQVRAMLKNADGVLLPGMFASLSINSAAPEKHITLPATAITYSSFGNSVYVVEDKGKDKDGKPNLVVRQSFVTTGETRGDQVSVLTGVKEGEQIVIAGQVKLGPGVQVIVDNTIKPASDPNPKPVDQ